MSEAEPIRLNRFLAQLGVGSRRYCDDLISAGKVRVGGKRVTSPGTKVVPGEQSINVDGTTLETPGKSVVLLLHKPRGVVSTVSDPQGRPTVLDFCRRFRRHRRLYPIGRLDVNTTGALLMTNDGILCYHLTHPSFQVPKTYLAKVRGGFDELKLERLRRMTDSAPAKGKAARGGDRSSVTLVKKLDKATVLKIALHEGRNRQVRRMCESVGLRVVKLKRVNFGPVSIRNLPVGSIRPLTKKELDRLREIAGIGD